MIQIEHDSKNNLLLLIFKDVIDIEQGEKLYADLRDIVPKLYKGFRLITDLSELDSMHLDIHSILEQVMDLCNEHGVSKIIRIIPDISKDIGFNIMSLFHYSHDVVIHTYKSFEEARKSLI